MSLTNYMPIIKTGDAEFRAIDNLSANVKDAITPLFELTKSRKSPKKEHGDIYRRLDKLKEVYGNRTFCLDLTTEETLINYQIKNLQDSADGYSKWVDFLVSQKTNFPNLIPVIMFDFVDDETEDEFYAKLISQVEELNKEFNFVAYRFPYNYQAYEYDVNKINSVLSDCEIISILDIGFIQYGKDGEYTTEIEPVIAALNKLNCCQKFLTSSSYPKIPTDYGDDKQGEFDLGKLKLYEKFKPMISYGDYATIHPIRSSQAGGNGWIPRIDMPTVDGTIFYYRSRKKDDETKYSSAYIRVAKKVVKNKAYQKTKRYIGDCWGIDQIELAAFGKPQGLSPSFWISVRMNIHMTLRSKILAN